MDAEMERKLRDLLRKSENARSHADYESAVIWSAKAHALIAPNDRFCSICRGWHAEDIQHACE